MDTASLSDYEQSLSIRERDTGIVTARNADTHVTDAVARVRLGVATRQREGHEVKHRHSVAIKLRITNDRYKSANVMAGLVVPP